LIARSAQDEEELVGVGMDVPRYLVLGLHRAADVVVKRRGRARRPPLIDKSSGHCQGPTSRLACPAAAAWPRRPTPTRRTASAALRRNADRPRMARKRARTVTHDPRRYQHSGYVSMPSSLICGGDGRGCGVYAAPWCTRG
jgi:hypothetical protein